MIFFKLGADGDIHVSMRSKYNVDIRAIAARHGGGGHKNAAGFKLRGPVESIRDGVDRGSARRDRARHAVEAVNGALLIDKPCGPTSHDIVAFVRRTLKISRVGHTGTLDPLATGLLVILSATRRAWRSSSWRTRRSTSPTSASELRRRPTTRRRSRRLEVGGWRSAGAANFELPSRIEIEQVLLSFTGTFPQTPPPFSAKKVEGVRAYDRARKNQPVELKPIEVTVRTLEV